MLFILVSTIALCSFIWLFTRRNGNNRPPGPIGLPLVGYIPFLSDKPYKDFDEMRSKYGDVFGLQLGSRYTVVLNSDQAIRDALGKDAFLDRPPGFFKLSEHNSNLGTMNGKNWKEHMIFTRSTIRHLGAGNNQLAEMTATQITQTLDEIDSSTKRDVNIRKLLSTGVNNVVCSLVYGKAYDKDDPMTRTINGCHDANSLIEPTSMVDNMPYLTPLLWKCKAQLKRIMSDVNSLEESLKVDVDNHEKQFDENSLNDYMDHFYMEMKKRGNSSEEFNKGVLVGSSQLLLIAGTHGLRLTIEWALLQMVREPKIQEKVHQEIINVLGSERLPTMADKSSLPFTEAVLLESARRNTVAPTSVIRWTNSDSQVLGLNIPEGTKVISNINALHMDPKCWKNPLDFDPSRFLNENGDVLKKMPPSYMPFSYGKRSCPADRIATSTVFLFFVSIIQKYKVVAPSTGLCMDSINHGNSLPRFPYLQFERR